MEGHLLAGQLSTDAIDDPGRRLASLFDAHHDRLYRLARRLVSGSDDALDLVQETFLRAARSPVKASVGDSGAEEAWLVRILINIQRDEWRKSAVRARHGATLNDRLLTGRVQNPEAALITKATVWQALDRLPPRRRAIIVMYELDGMPISAIAGLLGIAAVTVRWHLSAGRRDLAQTLKPHLGDFHENS